MSSTIGSPALADGVQVPLVFREDYPVVPLRMFVHVELLPMARPGCTTGLRRWLGSWCNKHLHRRGRMVHHGHAHAA